MFEESYRKLLQIEQDCSTRHLTIDGCDAWPIVRHRLWTILTAKSLIGPQNPVQLVKKVQTLLVGIFRVVANQFTKSVVTEPTNSQTLPTVLTFGRDKHFTIDTSSKMRCDRVLGPISRHLSQEFYLEQFILDNSQNRNPSDTEKRFRRDLFVKKIFVRGLFSSGLIRACKRYGVSPLRIVMLLFIDGLIFASARKGMKRYFRIHPQPLFVLIDTWYSPDMMGIVSVLRELEITVIEVQHGFIHPKHAMYVNWPSETGEYTSLRPNVFWCWSNLAIEILNIKEFLCHTGRNVFVGGYPWTYQQVQGLINLNSSLDEELPLKKVSENGTRVLITLGAPQIDGCEDLPDPLLNVIMKRRDTLFVLLPHPNIPNFQYYLDMKFKNHIPSNVIIAPLNSNVYSLLSKCTHHVTAMSTVALESPALGVPSLIIGKIGIDLFFPLIDKIWLYATDTDARLIDEFLMTPFLREQEHFTYIDSSPLLLNMGIERCKSLV
jgi:hypothetical protein